MSSTADFPTSPVAPAPDAFAFGRNWERYIDGHLDEGRERIAADSVADLVGDLAGKAFLDIGCGSGLFSLCAHRAGASEVISLDVDPEAVRATQALRAWVDGPSNWRVLHRSILDASLPDELEPVDVVYSWGVLHHTGDMYRGIRNAAALVRPGGLLAIALYNRRDTGWLTSSRWWHIKRAYNRVPRAAQVGMEVAYGSYWALGTLKERRNPVQVAREYRRSRGMALSTDLVDWLGGYPYEYASAREVTDYCETVCGLRTVKVICGPTGSTGNNEFVFRREMPAGPEHEAETTAHRY